MKNLSLLVSLVLAFAMSVWAQTPSPNDTQSGTNSSAAQSGSSATPGNSGSPTMGSQDAAGAPSSQTNTAEQGKIAKEHKLKGCLESESGTYELREKNGKQVPLTGAADMSQYANHEVVVHGDWATGAAASSTSDMSKSDKQFTVSKVDSVSDTCKSGKNSKDKNNPGPTGQQ